MPGILMLNCYQGVAILRLNNVKVKDGPEGKGPYIRLNVVSLIIRHFHAMMSKLSKTNFPEC